MTSVTTIKQTALRYTNCRRVNDRLFGRKFKAMFGASALVVTIIYDKLTTQLHTRATPTHLLMGMHFLACYPKDDVGASTFRVTTKAYNEWHWYVVEQIARLTGIVVWEDRKLLLDPDEMSNTFVTVDGIDCNVPEAHPFRASLMSHKTRHAAYKYELVISIRAGIFASSREGGGGGGLKQGQLTSLYREIA
ncbi:hypothetical protein SARC_01732 [Sphaeroforma arctica JP610]|uniref:Uncharacterized protein n=1 Tax=Sphaeroforma arctica JP610 TaxID=667725 RepID=A0A0L0GB56_9EUKA|nr:hypothetical protein SARC_01732 [Sphaeroforma arctica JP610]KNC86116.1 hypothetical protein SARC_01732 [Sphaeroforma arctica JP610]|eukprot:XP_014160018.1 hypothetical protein SARC_01732 [Sphaeroforma arctica JP610]